jgi:hypothetical protein
MNFEGPEFARSSGKIKHHFDFPPALDQKPAFRKQNIG